MTQSNAGILRQGEKPLSSKFFITWKSAHIAPTSSFVSLIPILCIYTQTQKIKPGWISSKMQTIFPVRWEKRFLKHHRQQPTRLPCSWDSQGKNTGVGCHFLLQCIRVKSESEVAQSCPTLRDPMDCSPPGSSIHGIFQARVLEWGAIAFSDKCISILYWCFSFWLTSLCI